MPERPKPKLIRSVSATNRRQAEQVVYGIHAVRPREVCATQFITADVTAAVTRYIMDCEGREQAQALYVVGTRQEASHISDDRRIYANGHGTASAWAPK